MPMTAVEPKIAEGVLEVLRKHDCENEFWARIELARECFPDIQRMDVRWMPDPDEEWRTYVGVDVKIGGGRSWSELHALYLGYVDAAVKRFPFRPTPSFVVTVAGIDE